MTAITEFVDRGRRACVVVLTVNYPPITALSHGVRKGPIEGASKPVIAAVHGADLGFVGLEVALACHYRVGVRAVRFSPQE